ncbi:RagB/SusD family nutrient uptake outer membrane protein [Sphingobacterium sp. SYP-B4668]|uniref:RagB/SusD family nutrient uptake outer membrane protein n=1 Tax=Sphingobacterium sp. SYP-B4668 TaxID=2996035 RepID=UPI0022DDCE8D|nr:RagB/SusD family nutrient uptake outer membrane protein [Sphingobacterium sp. SYP-B4668]
MKKTILSALFTSFLLLGCNSYLDIKPKGFTIPEFIDDYKLLMNNQGLIRATPAFPDYLTDHIVSGNPVDISGTGFDSYPTVKKRLYTFEHGAIFEDGQADSYWETAYSHIFTYNVVINNVLQVTDGKDTEKKRLWAEAKVGRAFEYLNLVNIYGRHYDSKTAATDYGVPLVLSEDINKSYERVSVQQIYTLVENDLQEALPLLGKTANTTFQPLQSVGYAFLSRMYLYQGRYMEALQNAREALKQHSYLEDYTLYTNREQKTFGRVCRKDDQDIPFPDIRTNKESIWSRLGTSSYGSLNAEVFTSQDLIDTYKKDLTANAIDMRYQLFFCRDQASFGSAVMKFPGRVLWAPYIEMNTGFSTPELILIAAECEARVGSTEEALKLINMLRDSRIDNNIHIMDLNKVKTLSLVLDERRREMPYLASTRLIDLKRLHTSGDLTKTIVHKLETQEWSMESSDIRMILPVPPKVLSLNPSIPQYER